MVTPTPGPGPVLTPVPSPAKEGFAQGATAKRCPSGVFHTWRYRKDPDDGLGWYECECGTLLTKGTLKRLTDRG